MKTNYNKASPLAKALLATAEGMHKAGLITDDTYAKITARLAKNPRPDSPSVTARRIRRMWQRAKMSQATRYRPSGVAPKH